MTAKTVPNQYQSTASTSNIKDQIARTQSNMEYENTKEALAAFSIGIAYMGTNNQKAIDILVHRLRLSSCDQQQDIPLLEKNPRCFACLALGLVASGSCNMDVADVILRVMAGNSPPSASCASSHSAASGSR